MAAASLVHSQKQSICPRYFAVRPKYMPRIYESSPLPRGYPIPSHRPFLEQILMIMEKDQ